MPNKNNFHVNKYGVFDINIRTTYFYTHFVSFLWAFTDGGFGMVASNIMVFDPILVYIVQDGKALSVT